MPPKQAKGGKPAVGGAVKKKEKEEKLKPWEQQSESEQQSTIAKAREQLSSLGLNGIELVVSKETQYPRGEVNNIFGVVGSVTAKLEKKLEKFAKVFNEVASKFDVAMTSFGSGDKVPEAEVFDFDGKNVDLFDDKECQIVILLFWAPWVPGYQEALKRVYKLAETHGDEWSGKVAFINVAIDGSIDSAQKELANLKLDSKHVTNYWGGDDEDEGDETSAVAKYDIQHLPDLLIINNVGQLVKRTDPTEINVERVISKLLAGETVSDADYELPKKSKKGSWNDFPEDKRAEIVSQASDLISKAGGQLEGVLLVTSDSRIIQIGGSEKQDRSLLLLGKIEQKAETALSSVIKAIESQGVTDLNKLVMVSPAPADIKPTAKCSNCSQAFVKAGSKTAAKSPASGSKKGSNKKSGSKKRSNKKGGKADKAQDKGQEAGAGVPGDKWHCAICVEPYTLCEDCELGRVKTKCHPDYHIFYRIPVGYNEANLATVEYGIGAFNVMMGKQHSEEDEEPLTVVHDQVFCNGCPEGKGHIQGQDRYKCAHCDDFDFCASCYNELLANGTKHDKDHLFVKITDSEFVTIEGDDDEGDEMDDIDPDEYERVMEQLKSHNLEDDFIDGEELVNGEPKIAVVDDEEEEEAPKPKAGGKAAAGKGGKAKKDQCCDHDHDHDHAHGAPKKGGKADKKPTPAPVAAAAPTKVEPKAEPKAAKTEAKPKAEAKPATNNKGAADKGAAPASNKGAAPKKEEPKVASNKGKPAPAKTEEKKGGKKADAPAAAPVKTESKKTAAPAAAAPAKPEEKKAAKKADAPAAPAKDSQKGSAPAAPAKDSQKGAEKKPAPKKGGAPAAGGKGKAAKSKVEQAVSVPLPDDD